MRTGIFILFSITILALSSCSKDNKTGPAIPPAASKCQLLTLTDKPLLVNFKYSANGNVSGYQINYIGSTAIIEQLDFAYNNKGQIIQFPANDSTGLINKFEYNADSTLAKTTYFYGVKAINYVRYIYDAQKRPVTSMTFNASNNAIEDSIIISYDSRGNVMKTVSIDKYKNVLDSTIYQYDIKNNPYSGLSYNYINYRENFTCWGPNNVINEAKYNGSGTLQYSQPSSYDYNSTAYPVMLHTPNSSDDGKKFTYNCH